MATSNAADLTSIPALLARNAREHGSSAAYREKEFGIWQSWTWADAAQEIEAMALGFIALGVSAGDHVAIIGPIASAKTSSAVSAQVQLCQMPNSFSR